MLVGAGGHRFLREVNLAGVVGRAGFTSPLRADLRERTRQRLLALGATSTLTGGALGADLDVTWLGATDLGLRSTVLAPKATWRDGWEPGAVEASDELFHHPLVAVEYALPIDHVSDGRAAAFYRDAALCWRLRDAGGTFLAWWDGRPSGTSHTVRLARGMGIPVEALEPRPTVVAGYTSLDVGGANLARLFAAPVAVVSVNAAGIFGAGLAREAASRWPACGRRLRSTSASSGARGPAYPGDGRTAGGSYWCPPSITRRARAAHLPRLGMQSR